MPCSVPIGVSALLRRSAACLMLGLAVPAGADVTITQLANEGVIIEDGVSTRVMIDGMVVEPYSLYGGLPAELQPFFAQASGPFAGIDLALASHQHHEHNQPIYACSFMQNSAGTLFASSSQVIDLMREKCRAFITSSPRIRVIDPRYDQPEMLQVKEATVSTFLLTHGVGKYAVLQHFGHLVELGGMRILHIGDAAMEAEDFARAGVDRMDVDIALIPFRYFQPGPGGGTIRRYLDTPHKIAVHIPPGELAEVKDLLRLEFPAVMILESVLDRVHFSATAPPLP
jgi:L-ascorbate metabolism protein UlaG (beta-lactamase superfamily)